MSSGNSILMLPLKSGCLLFIFSSPVFLVRISSTMMNSSDNGHPCLVHDLKGKAFSFMMKYDNSHGFFTDVRYQVEEIPFSS